MSQAAALNDDLLARAEALVPTLAARAEETERLRRIPDETIADLKAAGLHRICQPARFGGAETPLDAACEIVATLSGGCSSTGWVAGVYTDHQMLVGMFDRQAADDIWSENPEALLSAGFTPGGTAETVAGGWRIAGEWTWSSGCDHADWLIVASVLETGPDGGREPNFCIVPRAEVEIVDNWHVMGMAGTGSKKLRVVDAFVPRHRTLPFRLATAGGNARGQHDAPPLYKLPHISCVPFMLVSPSLGIARSVLDGVVAQMGARTARGVSVADYQSIQLHVAEAAAQIDAARLLVMRDTGEAMAAMREGRDLTLMERARNRRDHAYVVRLCREAVTRLFGTLGGAGIFLDEAMQRKFRDMHSMSGHFALNWDVSGTTYGRVALGLDPQTPRV